MKNKVAMHINRKPGETMEVDWAGQTAVIVDAADTVERQDTYLFVAALPYSGYEFKLEVFICMFKTSVYGRKTLSNNV